MRECILRFIRSLRSRKGSPTMEYVIIIAVGALFAGILLSVFKSEPVQEALRQRVACSFPYLVDASGNAICKDPRYAAGYNQPTENKPENESSPSPVFQPVPPKPPIPDKSTVPATGNEPEPPWYACLFSLNCLKKTGGEGIGKVKDFFKDFFVLDADDLRKEALQHCGQDAECIQKSIRKKRLSAGLHFSPGLGGLSHSIEKLIGWNPLDALADFVVEHPFEAVTMALFLLTIPFTGPVGVGGAVGVGATESVLGGVGAAAIAGLGRWLSRRYFPRVASWLASRIPLPSRATRFLPVGMEGGFTASAESGWFDWMKDGKINWKKALVNGALGVAVGFGTPFIMDGIGTGLQKGIGTGLQQMRHLPVAFEITPEGSILVKRLGDTEVGQKLQDAGDAIRRSAGTGDEVVTIPKLDPNAGQVREITKIYRRGPNQGETVVIKRQVKNWEGKWITLKNGTREKVEVTMEDGTKVSVPFNNGFPDFSQWTKVEMTLPRELWFKSDYVQFRYLNKQLYKMAQKNPELKNKFSPKELESLRNGDTPKGYTWHHHQTHGKMQLVNRSVHQKTGHTGGREIWGGGDERR